ncbi:glutathione S-transferase family protein [Rhizobium sp. SSA_523]|uniref:glutathione S-transferase family protein n=1 Tax=Rhizobium sp. SSA_523 TaxID=2952477 RepID=UPI00209060B4|nr:glutathione S-transferase family protein [Rhizobium sp. SSA_523]MCO5734062.1 glutathione S-transferase family protein [Rhizobium sp. SSA_523]WKC24700.1 glutathione S-transferase family protein [Rhizobium sp. SSA_523]
MSSLLLYTNPMSRGRIARWMLEEVGLAYEVKVLAFGPEMKSADYRAVNPMGKVPALQHGGNVVTECAAICAYLADVFPETGLSPQTDAERAAYYRWMFFAAGPLEAAVSNRSLGFEVPADKRPMMGYGSYPQVIDTLEQAVSQSDHIAGDRFTAADVYVGSHLMWGMEFGSIEKRPAFEAYVAHIAQRPAHIRATELDDALAAERAAPQG